MRRQVLLIFFLISGTTLYAQTRVEHTIPHDGLVVAYPVTQRVVPIGGVVDGDHPLDMSIRLSPLSTNGVQGSVGGAGITLRSHRIGGVGVYGYDLTSAFVTANVPTGQFDVAKTAWLTGTNWTGGQGFGGWFGANTPSSEAAGQSYLAGAAIGTEINVGNRWADFGPQIDLGIGARYTVGLQVVPDPVPADDVVTRTTYPGTFGIAIARAQYGHRWWTGILTSHDAIMRNGHARISRGSSQVADAPKDIEYADGHWKAGIDLSNSKFSEAALVLADGQRICFNAPDACLFHAKGKLYYEVAGEAVFSVNDRTGDATFKGQVIENGRP